MNAGQQSAFDVMDALLDQYDLSSLSDTLKSIIMSGVTDTNQIQLQLEGTDAWKQRFAGNEILKQKGLNVLSVADYLSTETSMAQVLKNYGLPSGFYDDHADFAQWIGNSVSPNELQQRAQMYSDLYKRQDQGLQDQLKSMGFTEGDMLSYLMDPTRAMPLLQQQYTTSLLGAAARNQGIVADNNYLNHLGDIGITESQAIQGFGQVAQTFPSLSKLAGIYGVNYNQQMAEQGVFENNAQANQTASRLASQERAAFSGNSGIQQGGINRTDGGQF